MRSGSTLIDLSRDDGVTIFLSTHFMNEADRCDRISLMHAGKVLAVGAPQELVQKRGSASLEDAFIAYLAEAAGINARAEGSAEPCRTRLPNRIADAKAEPCAAPRRFDPGRLWAYARRETMELLRDPIRLAFAFFGPLILMFAFGYGISFDVEHLRFARFRPGSNAREPRVARRLFVDSAVLRGTAADRQPADELERRFRSGELQVAVEIPPGFGRDLESGRSPEVARVARWQHAVPRRDDEELCHRLTPAKHARPDRATRPQAAERRAPSISRRAFATTRRSRASMRWCRA